jgi:XTP/dITP diphosphohydrolase
MELLVATTNAGKLAEIEEALKSLSVQVLPLNALKNWPSVVEDGKTFEENARKKARTLAAFSGRLTLADDSGLEVDALGGAPGIHSARYSGQDALEANDARNNEKLLQALINVPEENRGACFVCVLALCAPTALGGGEWLFRAQCQGRIAFAPSGENGFGYDPLFLYSPLGRTFGALDREAKNRVSHRGRALKKLTEAWLSLQPFQKKL